MNDQRPESWGNSSANRSTPSRQVLRGWTGRQIDHRATGSLQLAHWGKCWELTWGGATNTTETNHGGRVQNQRAAATPCFWVTWGSLLTIARARRAMKGAGPSNRRSIFDSAPGNSTGNQRIRAFENHDPNRGGTFQHVYGALDGRRINRQAIGRAATESLGNAGNVACGAANVSG